MKKTFLASLLIIALAITTTTNAQVGIGVSTANIHPSAQLDVSSTTKGFLPPRMTEVQKIAISNPASGLLVYQTDGVSGYYYFDGAVWKSGLGPQGPAGPAGLTATSTMAEASTTGSSGTYLLNPSPNNVYINAGSWISIGANNTSSYYYVISKGNDNTINIINIGGALAAWPVNATVALVGRIGAAGVAGPAGPLVATTMATSGSLSFFGSSGTFALTPSPNNVYINAGSYISIGTNNTSQYFYVSNKLDDNTITIVKESMDAGFSWPVNATVALVGPLGPNGPQGVAGIHGSDATISIGAIGSIASSNPNGATITAGVLSLTPANGTNAGIITTDDQTFLGNKVFNNSIAVAGNLNTVGNSYTNSNVGIGENLNVGGDATIIGTTTLAGTATAPTVSSVNDSTTNIATTAFVRNALATSAFDPTQFVARYANPIAIGESAGIYNQGNSTIALGWYAGNNTQGEAAIALGKQAGRQNQGVNGIALGNNAGNNNQGIEAVALGSGAGLYNQGSNAIALGSNTGQFGQGQNTIALGKDAGNFNQGIGAVALGKSAGNDEQGTSAIALGGNAGQYRQGSNAVALGAYAGYQNQGQYAVSLGIGSGSNDQGQNAIAIGFNSGLNFQGQNAIAIGNGAGTYNQSANSIILNASGNILNAPYPGFFVKPIRENSVDFPGYFLTYDPLTSEIKYSNWMQNYFFGPSNGRAFNTINANSIIAGSLALSSDKRLKTNIVGLPNSLDVINKLNPVSYKRKDSIASAEYKYEEMGFIAQEIQKVLPIVVKEGTEKDKILSVNYISLIPLLTKGIQEQQVQISSLQKEIDDLKKMVEQLLNKK